MAQVRVYIFSVLAMHRTVMKDRFTENYPGSWIVWEPGVWKPAAGSPVNAETLPVSGDGRPERPTRGDPLCFALHGEEPLKLGRAPDNDIRINEASVSRDHLLIEPKDGRWWAHPGSAKSVTFYQGQTLGPEGVLLAPGDELRVGHVTLSFHDPASLLARIDAMIAGARK